jgi:hypothetical protein
MNELTKEASKQTILEAISFLWLGGRGRVRKPRTAPYSGLQGHFRDYLTEIDVSSCETLPEDYQNHLDRKYVQKGGIDVESFRAWCEQLDAEDEEIKRTEERLF